MILENYMHAFGVFWRLTVTKIWTINGLGV